MASHSVDSRKNAASSLQRFVQIAKQVDNFCASVQVVQGPLSDTCNALNKKRIPSQGLCMSLIGALEMMSKPLSRLCSTFEKLAKLPDALIPLRLEVFMALCDTQVQVTQVESCTKRCYTHIIASAIQEVIEHMTKSAFLLLFAHCVFHTGVLLIMSCNEPMS
jgi:hypothetical protein